MRRSLVLAAAAAFVVAALARADAPRWRVWLCLPGRVPNYCNVNLSTTFVFADGSGVPRPVYTPQHGTTTSPTGTTAAAGSHAADLVIATTQLVSLAAAEAAAWRDRH